MAHHMPTQMFGYSEWSSTLIRTPPPTTTRAVAVTITLAAIRIDGGSRRNFDIRRSIGLGRVNSRLFRRTPAGPGCRALIDPFSRRSLSPHRDAESLVGGD